MTAVHHQALDPRDYVDREAHQSLLTEMVAGREDRRALLIADGSGQGKSDLMARLRLNCLEDDNRPSVLFADVRDIAAAFGILERSYLDTRNGQAYQRNFSRFTNEYASWEGTARVEVGGQGGTVRVDAAHAHVAQAGTLAGVLVTAAPAGVTSVAAQNKILDAFQRDLEAARDHKLVIMIDHYNRTEQAVRTWIDEALFVPCLSGQLPNVVMVLASTPDVRPYYAAKHSDLVADMPLTRLQDDPGHVRSLLRAHRLVREDEDDEALVQLSIQLLVQDFPISRILDLYKSKDTSRGR